MPKKAISIPKSFLFESSVRQILVQTQAEVDDTVSTFREIFDLCFVKLGCQLNKTMEECLVSGFAQYTNKFLRSLQKDKTRYLTKLVEMLNSLSQSTSEDNYPREPLELDIRSVLSEWKPSLKRRVKLDRQLIQMQQESELLEPQYCQPDLRPSEKNHSGEAYQSENVDQAEVTELVPTETGKEGGLPTHTVSNPPTENSDDQTVCLEERVLVTSDFESSPRKQRQILSEIHFEKELHIFHIAGMKTESELRAAFKSIGYESLGEIKLLPFDETIESMHAIIDLNEYETPDLKDIQRDCKRSAAIRSLIKIPDDQISPDMWNKAFYIKLHDPLIKHHEDPPAKIESNQVQIQQYEMSYQSAELKAIKNKIGTLEPTLLIESSKLKESTLTVSNTTRGHTGRLLITASDKIFELDDKAAKSQGLMLLSIKIQGLGVRMILFSPPDPNTSKPPLYVLCQLDKPLLVYDAQWKLIKQTTACFVGKMISNSWNTTSRGAKLVDGYVYHLALPENYKKDAQGLSLRGTEPRLMRFQLETEKMEEQELAKNVEDFHVDGKGEITYISGMKIHRTNDKGKESVCLDMSTVLSKYLTNIVQVQDMFVVAGWVRTDNIVNYYLIEEPADRQLKIKSEVAVPNETALAEPKGPLSQLVVMKWRHEKGKNIPILIGGTTTGALNILALSKEAIVLLTRFDQIKSSGNCALSIYVDNDNVVVSGNTFIYKIRLQQ